MYKMTFSQSARFLIVGTAACLVIGLTGGTALAAGTWTIKPGGAVTLGPLTATAKDTRTGSTIKCTSGDLKGTLKAGSGLKGSGAGDITGGSVSGCTGPSGLDFAVTLLDLPWVVSLVSYDASTGVVHGTISHMEIGVSGPGCTFVIDGTAGGASDGRVDFTYNDSTHAVKFSDGDLHVYDVSGCLGLLNNGDPVSLSGSAKQLSPPQVITSP